MVSERLFLGFFDAGFMKGKLLLLILVGIVLLGEILLIIWVGGVIGIYLSIACTATIGLLGVMAVGRVLGRNTAVLKEEISRAGYREKGFAKMVSLSLSAICFILPGFVTDLIGVLLLMPVVELLLGRWLLRVLRIPTNELYEYMKLHDG